MPGQPIWPQTGQGLPEIYRFRSVPFFFRGSISNQYWFIIKQLTMNLYYSPLFTTIHSSVQFINCSLTTLHYTTTDRSKSTILSHFKLEENHSHAEVYIAINRYEPLNTRDMMSHTHIYVQYLSLYHLLW